MYAPKMPIVCIRCKDNRYIMTVSEVDVSSPAEKVKGRGIGKDSLDPPSPITDLTKSPISHLHYYKLMKTQLKCELQEVFQINPILIYFFLF